MATAAPSHSVSQLADQRKGTPSRLLVPIALCLLGVLCLGIDLPVATFFKTGKPWSFLREILDNAEPFGHGVGVAYILLAVYVLDASRRNWILALLGGALGAGLTADVIKLLIARTRPRRLDLMQATVWQTFGDLLPFANGAGGDSHSFPSAHTATATGLAVVLGTIYPRGRVLFFCLAALTGLQRISCSAHFPSDVCVGAAVGWMVGHGVLALRRRIRGEDPVVADGGL